MIWNADTEFQFYHYLKTAYGLPPLGQALVVEILGPSDFKLIESTNEFEHRKSCLALRQSKTPYCTFYNLTGSLSIEFVGNYIYLATNEADGMIEDFEEYGATPKPTKEQIREEFELLHKMLIEQSENK